MGAGNQKSNPGSYARAASAFKPSAISPYTPQLLTSYYIDELKFSLDMYA